MEKDLLAALEFFKKGEQLNSIFKPEIDVTRLFLSRVYLFQKKYDKVISVCNDLISQSAATVATIKDIENYPEDEFGYTYLYNSKNPSILFTWGLSANFRYRAVTFTREVITRHLPLSRIFMPNMTTLEGLFISTNILPFLKNIARMKIQFISDATG